LLDLLGMNVEYEQAAFEAEYVSALIRLSFEEVTHLLVLLIVFVALLPWRLCRGQLPVMHRAFGATASNQGNAGRHQDSLREIASSSTCTFAFSKIEG
jgi:hypothetical protein